MTHKGTISKIEDEEKALKELDKYKERVNKNRLSKVEKDFLNGLDNFENKIKKIKK